jgi:hypothetical protein
MMACLIVRSTYRLHDNGVLARALADPLLSVVYLPIDTARVLSPRVCLPTLRPYTAITAPRFALGTRAHKHAWGYHQYAFLLLAMRSFVHDLRAHLAKLGRKDVRVHPCKGTANALAALVANAHRSVYIDRVDDPAWDPFDEALRRVYGPDAHRALHWVTTQTLLDWYDDPESVTFLDTWRSGWRISASNQVFKDYVVARLAGTKGTKVDWSTVSRAPTAPAAHKTHEVASSVAKKTVAPKKAPTRRRPSPRTPRRRARRRSRRRSRSAPPRLGGRGPTASSLSLDLDAEWSRWSKVMVAAHLRPYDVVTSGLEKHALDHLETTVRAMADPKWEKRLTNVSLGVRDHATKAGENTSKLSPYFALGVLSPRWAFRRWWGASATARAANQAVPSSAVAQLLWRETFHAASRLPHWWASRTKHLPRAARFWRHEPDAEKPYGGWRVWKSDDTDPLYKGWLTATTGAPDLDESLLLLVTDGWIHHLRRHLIADYLTRGKVRADWMLGEQWFRQTLVDHDACVNRGNWMWLSASDFSIAQMRRHYGYKDYVTRHSYGQRVRPLPSADGPLVVQTGGQRKPRKAASKRSKAASKASKSKASNAKGVYGGYPDPRKRYDGHYKVPPAPTPPAAKVDAKRAAVPTRDATTHRFAFADVPGFDPDCSPAEVLAMGAFGGTYFRDIWSGVRQRVLSGETALRALPSEWWKGLDKATQLCSPTYDRRVNHFKATCGGSLDMWESSGWVNPIDPYGWFQWYCHFFQGRRTSDDARQIDRWTKFTDPNGRFVKPLLKKCRAAKTSPNDPSVSPVTRQNLLHWGRLRL